MRIKQLSNSDLDSLIETVALRYRVKCEGVNTILIRQTLQSEFSNYLINDFNDAFIKHCSGRFMISKEQEGNKPYGDLSSLFICQVLNGFNKYKADYLRQHPPKIETPEIKQLSFDEKKYLTEETFEKFKNNEDLKGINFPSIYEYLKSIDEISIPKDEYKILMLEIREEIENEARSIEYSGKNPFYELLALSSKMIFDFECLKRVVLRYFEEKMECVKR